MMRDKSHEPNARWWIKKENADEGILTRYVITGTLVLQTPAHFGNGDVSELADMPILRDSVDGRQALLTGSSIAGALRSYLREYRRGYGKQPSGMFHAEHLFGTQFDQKGFASLLTVDDGFSQESVTELRDGVKLDPKTRTADKGALYNFELLQAGTTFELRFELAIPKGHDGGRFTAQENHQNELLKSLAIALQGLEQGEIRLGKRKRRGFGQCRVRQWQVKKYDMTQPANLINWLERPTEGVATDACSSEKIADLLLKANNLSLSDVDDNRSFFHMTATFSLDKSSLLIRSAGSDANAPDMVHLQSNGKPIVSGTSLAGAIRARALRIANTLGLPQTTVSRDDNQTEAIPEMVLAMFGGQVINDKGEIKMKASRLIIDEIEIEHGLDTLVQNRVKLDRFTGGSYPSALFNQQPVWGQPNSCIKLNLTLQDPQPAEVGLLLHVLKDMWTSDLPIGGEASVGRGRLSDKQARLVWQQGGPSKQCWRFERVGDNLNFIEGQPQQLDELFGNALGDEVSRNNGAGKENH